MIGPSAFNGDPYGYLTNQCGHAYLVGFPLALALCPWFGLFLAPIMVAVIYGLAWEIGVQKGRLWRDSFEDTVHVLAGASVLCAALSGDALIVLECMGAQAGLLAVGVWRRSR
jgi:energy-converting hydrogenase Eha subunit A